MNPKSIQYQKFALNRLRFKLWMLKHLPSIAFWGVRVKVLTAQHCSVTIPYRWQTQNPFGSIYFGALAGAAELSTGALCQMIIIGKGNYSMLVTKFSAEFTKKATSMVTFTCLQGLELAEAIESLKAKGDTTKFEMVTQGTDVNGNIVGNVSIEWSFKRKD